MAQRLPYEGDEEVAVINGRTRSAYSAPAYSMPAPAVADTSVESSSNPQGPVQQWRVIRRHKGAIILAAAFGVLVAFLVTLPQTPIYQAHATLEVQDIDYLTKVKQLNPTADLSGFFGLSDIATQVKILQSETLLDRVNAKLRGGSPVASAPAAAEAADSGWRKALNLPSPKTGPLEGNNLNLKVRAANNTRIIEIQYDSASPDFASKFINTLVSEYIDSNIEARWKASQRTTEWLTKQLDEMRIKLEHSEDALQAYARNAGLMFTGGGDKDSVSTERLRQLQQSLSQAQAERASAQSRYELASSTPPDALPEIMNDTVLKSLVDKLLELRRQEAELLTTFTPKHEKVRKVQAQIAPLEAALLKERAAVLARIQSEFQAAKNKERLLATEYASQYRVVTGDSEKAVQYGILKREADSNRQIYDDMLQKVKASGIASAVEGSNVRVLDTAKTPVRPYKPDFKLNCLLGLFGGLAMGIGLVFVRDRADRTIQEPGDIQYWVNLPELGVIPSATAENAKRMYSARRSGAGPGEPAIRAGGTRHNVELMTWEEKPSQVAEAFRSVLTSILFSGDAGNPPRVLALTSGMPSEGKTTSATNLAIALAEVHRKVLLVDADLRKPRIHHVFGVPNDRGLSNLLKQHDLTEEDLLEAVHETAIPDLFVLSSGPSTHAAANLLYSMNLPDLLEMMRGHFDMVIIDTPPMLGMTDARVVGSLADGMVLVVRSRKTTRDAALAMRQRLEEDQTRVLGTILNDWNPKQSPGGYYGNYGGYGGYSYYGKSTDEDTEEPVKQRSPKGMKSSLKRSDAKSPAVKSPAVNSPVVMSPAKSPVVTRPVAEMPVEPACTKPAPIPLEDTVPDRVQEAVEEQMVTTPEAAPAAPRLDNLRVLRKPDVPTDEVPARVVAPRPVLSWVGVARPVTSVPLPRSRTPGARGRTSSTSPVFKKAV